MWDQIGRWAANREVEPTIPQVHFAENTEIIKVHLGLRHIVANEAVTLEQAKQAREITYNEWYQDRLVTVTLPMAARVLSISSPAILTSFSPGWNLYVVTDEFNLSLRQVKKLTDTLELITVNEVLALALTLGPTTFVAGPLAIIVVLVAAGSLLEFYTYLVLAQGKLNGLIGLKEVIFMQDKQNYTEPLLKLRASLHHWLYSFVAGFCVRAIRGRGPSTITTRSKQPAPQ